MRLSPRDPLLFHWHCLIGVANLYLGRMGRAFESLRKSVEINPNWALSQFVLAGALGAQRGTRRSRRGLCRRPSPFAELHHRQVLRRSGERQPSYLAQRERLHEGLRLAGVPES